MTSSKLFLILTLSLLSLSVFAQSAAVPDSVLEKKKEAVKDMISALEYYLNVLGAERTAVSEKEVIINGSYAKLFANAKVQVEDDLEENRSTPIYKDVQAYLKDIDFFFKNVVFDFEITEILAQTKEDGSPFYKVELVRNLQGTSLSGEPINTTQKRFIELNLIPKSGELKIASIYTNKLSRDKQLAEWYKTLTVAWRVVLKRSAKVTVDSLTIQDITRLAMIDSLDLSKNELILDLEPIYQLTNLKYLKISNTWISDLKPLRSINTLQSLDVSNTSVYDLQYLKYHSEIQSLNLSNCHVEDFSILKSFEKLKRLNLSRIKQVNLAFLGDLITLEDLNLSEAEGTANINFTRLYNLKKLDLSASDITTLNGFDMLKSLTDLNFELTTVDDMNALGALTNLKTLNFTNTKVASLSPLMNLKSLTKIYCDNAPLDEASVEAFTTANPKTLVVRNTKELDQWWTGMSSYWRRILTKYIDNPTPNSEDLIQLLKIDSLNFDGAGIATLAPISMLKKVHYLNIDNNPQLTSLKGLESLDRLEEIHLNATGISDFLPLNKLVNIRHIEAENTKIGELAALYGLVKLRYLALEGSKVAKAEVATFLNRKEDLTIIFQTKALNAWWGVLSEPLKRAFKENVVMANKPSAKQLHELVALESLNITGSSVTNLAELSEFYRLKSLSLNGLSMTDLNSLPNIKTLESLSFTEMPVANLLSILKFDGLKKLDFSNTAVDDLRPLTTLASIEELNCSGTNIKRFTGIENLVNLRKLDCSNTKVFKFDRLLELKKLESVICFNTSLRANDIQKLKEALPKVEVVFY
ncbi:MAG: hypothetical protein ACI9Z3_001461 [Roseivirga sp.]|jgi:hypothetical protein